MKRYSENTVTVTIRLEPDELAAFDRLRLFSRSPEYENTLDNFQRSRARQALFALTTWEALIWYVWQYNAARFPGIQDYEDALNHIPQICRELMEKADTPDIMAFTKGCRVLSFPARGA